MSGDTVNLSIKAVPADLAERLRARAAQNHRSLQRELMAIIEAAAYSADTALPSAPGGAVRRKPRAETRSIDEVIEWIRQRVPEPSTEAPLGVDIIRAARDGR